jgi:hypothetical protein
VTKATAGKPPPKEAHPTDFSSADARAMPDHKARIAEAQAIAEETIARTEAQSDDEEPAP